MLRMKWAVAVVLCLGLVADGYAQQRAQRRGSRAGRSSRGGGLDRRFAEKSPALGESLPDVTLYDADGKEFPLRHLKGRHTVLVFGCLT